MTARRIDDLLLLARTTRHLQPAQLAHRARLRAQKAALTRFPGAFEARLRRRLPPQPGWPEDFLPLERQLASGFPGAEANADGRFHFLNEERRLGRPADWVQGKASQLWRYHLHYFEWAWSFIDHPNRAWASTEFRHLWRSWRDSTSFGKWDAWSPYVVSLRAWALCDLFGPLVAGTDDEVDFLADIALHAGFVRANLELDVGGNHLLKNLKALLGLGVFLEDEALVRVGTDHLSRQLEVQVLADGGHYERSPSYHCQVLGDLIDVAGLLSSSRRPGPAGLQRTIEAMQGWLGAMLLPDGEVPLFNDCTAVAPDRLSLLRPTSAEPAGLRVLQPSGCVVMDDGHGLHLVADVGPPCPPELPAHAQADCLSFVLSVDGVPVIVDTGTSTYQAGPRRDYERSTRAHNTVEIDGENQTEVWATFRAGRRANPHLEQATENAGEVVVSASHDGYERLPGRPRHRRTWRLSAGSLEMVDEITGEGGHSVLMSLVLAPGTICQSLDASRWRAGRVEITFTGGQVTQEPVEVAREFGRLERTQCLTVTGTGPLPRRLVITIKGQSD